MSMLRNIRERKGLSVSQLAAKASIPSRLIADYEDGAIVGLGIEAVPFRIDAETGLGLRAGVNSRNDLSAGMFIDMPLGIGSRPRLSFSARHDHDRLGLTLHAGLDLAL